MIYSKITFKITFYYKILICLACLYQLINATPLDDYVNKQDDNYKYEILKVDQFFDYKLYYINMTSQKWQNGKFGIEKINLKILIK